MEGFDFRLVSCEQHFVDCKTLQPGQKLCPTFVLPDDDDRTNIIHHNEACYMSSNLLSMPAILGTLKTCLLRICSVIARMTIRAWTVRFPAENLQSIKPHSCDTSLWVCTVNNVVTTTPVVVVLSYFDPNREFWINLCWNPENALWWRGIRT